MPFFCLRQPVANNRALPTFPPDAAFDTQSTAWQPVAANVLAQIWYRHPCGVWEGSKAGLPCVLLCDGFIARPRAFDALDPAGCVGWLGEALYRRGADALRDVEGQYALCFVNGDTGEIFAARDRLGAQALYWHRSGETVAVATKCRDLARLSTCTAVENPRFVTGMFARRGGHAPGDSAFLSINEVAPGGRVIFHKDEVDILRAPFHTGSRPDCGSPAEWVEMFRETFRGAVRDPLGRYGDVAVMLSGGLDSGPVLAAASRELQNAQRRVSAVSWVLPDFPDSDEEKWIRIAAEAAGVDLATIDGGGRLPFSNLSGSVVSPELPYYNSVRDYMLGCYERAAEESCVMVLTGTRGDLIYPQRFALLHDLIRRRDWRRLWAELGHYYRRLGLGGMYRDPAVRYPVSRLLGPLRGRREEPPPPWLTGYALQHLPARLQGPPEADDFPNPGHAHQVLGPAMTFGTSQENDFCQRYGLERRDPFHSEALIRLMLYLPVVLSNCRGRDKWIMREAMRSEIPDSVRLKSRTGKLGEFVRAGFARHREAVRELLMDQEEDVWARYVQASFVSDALSARPPTDAQLLVITGCIGYTLWRTRWDAAGC
ncbi:MAG: asparagine synthetase B family protein [Gammaproteobacteria bacterium]|nr:asparagine synthetase B family protein [Gammaproteobacteria bacterium]